MKGRTRKRTRERERERDRKKRKRSDVARIPSTKDETCVNHAFTPPSIVLKLMTMSTDDIEVTGLSRLSRT